MVASACASIWLREKIFRRRLTACRSPATLSAPLAVADEKLIFPEAMSAHDDGCEFHHGTQRKTDVRLAAQGACGAGGRNLVQRARDWADARGVPVYAHVRGLWLLARALKIQAEDSATTGSRMLEDWLNLTCGLFGWRLVSSACLLSRIRTGSAEVR